MRYAAAPVPDHAMSANESDLFVTVLRFIEATFPAVTSILSWEDELAAIGPIIPECY
jgi:hypothetical protein